MASNTSPVICTPQCRQTPPAWDETLRVTNMMPEVPASASPALGPRAGLNKNVVTAKSAPQGRWRCLDGGYRVHCVRTLRTRAVRTGMKPPICRSCWKAEWDHVCKGPLLAENERLTPKQAAPAPSWSSLLPRAVSEAQQQPTSDLRAMDDQSFRVAYNAVMAEYMRRRRARQKAT